MTTKLTLTIKKEVIEKAKIYAKGTQRSLSEMVQKYLESVTDPAFDEGKISPKMQKIVGIIKVPEQITDEDLENLRRDYLEKKHTQR